MKLYLVAREDLSPGRRAAQLCHAMRAFAERYPALERTWFERSNTLVLLEVDASSLDRLTTALRRRGDPVAPFYEPDLDDALTAIATLARDLTRGLPLALGSR